MRIRGSVDDLYAKIEAQQHRRFFKTHLSIDGLPFYTQVKYLILSRDPRDVFMSLWKHYSGYAARAYTRFNDTPNRHGDPLPQCPTDIHDFWTMWITQGWFDWEQEGYPFWGNMQHTQNWWLYRHWDNILFVHYADMIADPTTEIRRIADFLEIEISDEALAKVVRATSFTTMREEATRLKANVASLFNRGTNSRWREVLTEAELKMYEQTKTKVLSADCARWLEMGRRGLS